MPPVPILILRSSGGTLPVSISCSKDWWGDGDTVNRGKGCRVTNAGKSRSKEWISGSVRSGKIQVRMYPSESENSDLE